MTIPIRLTKMNRTMGILLKMMKATDILKKNNKIMINKRVKMPTPRKYPRNRK